MINRAKAYRHRSYGRMATNKGARLDPLKVDPSRTTLLRRSFAVEIRKRYNRVKFLIRQLIEEDDAFGLKPPNVSPLVTSSVKETPALTTNIIRRLKNGKYRLYSHAGKNLGTFPTKSQALKHEREVQYFKHASNIHVANAQHQWKFLSRPDQLREFLKWLTTIMNMEMRTGGDRLDAALMQYIRAGLAKGAGRAFDDTKKPRKALAASTEQLAFYAGTRDQFLRSAFNRPIAKEKLELLASRVFTDLKGVNEATATVIQRTLADGLVQGSSPRVIGRALAKVVEDIGVVRGTMIARTEIIRAHAEGQLLALADLGVEEVGVAVEWSTTRDGKVCPLCAPMQGVVLKLHEATGKIPRHPNCRCAWIPANVGESPIGQLRSKGAVKAALKESELPLAIDTARPTSTLSPTAVLNLMPSESLREFSRILNIFCPTGKGGGIDPTCTAGGNNPGAEGYGKALHERMMEKLDSNTEKVIQRFEELDRRGEAGGIIEHAVDRLASSYSSRVETQLEDWADFSIAHASAQGEVSTIARRSLAEEVRGHIDVIDSAVLSIADRVLTRDREGMHEAFDNLRVVVGQAGTSIQSIATDMAVTNVFCPTGKGGGIDPSCGKGTSGSAGSEPGAGAIARLEAISKRLNDIQKLAKSEPDLISAVAGVTVAKIPDVAAGAAKAAWKGAVYQQKVVADNLIKQGVPKKAANAVGIITATLDSTIIPGPGATIGAIALARIGGPALRAAGKGIKWLRAQLAGGNA